MTSIASITMGFGDRIHAYSQRFSWLQTSRLRAFSRHLLLSLTIVSSVFALVFFVWYPTPFFAAVGAWSIIRILVGVDLVLGPALTLIVFKPGKRLLIVDVVVIAIVQISALIYGVTVLYQERPQFAVFALDRFHILSEQDVPEELRAPFDWIQKPVSGPLLASARLPETLEERQRLLEETVFGGAPDIEQRPSLWVPYAEDIEAIIRKAYPIGLMLASESSRARVERLIARLGAEESALGFYPILSVKNDACIIVDLNTGELLDVLDIDPWEIISQ
jgi:hypothetical protein